jgi:predicted methyltransferase MtxX (methanogen marker protein 4)
MSAHKPGDAAAPRGTGFSREDCIADDKDALNVPASSRLKPVPRGRVNPDLLWPCGIDRGGPRMDVTGALRMFF